MRGRHSVSAIHGWLTTIIRFAKYSVVLELPLGEVGFAAFISDAQKELPISFALFSAPE
jgi:hypothetical protein